MKVEKDLTVKIRRVYLESYSIRKTAGFLNIKKWKVQKVVKDLKLSKPRINDSSFKYLSNINITKDQLIESYQELGSHKKVAEALSLGINKTKLILSELGVLKKPKHATHPNYKNGKYIRRPLDYKISTMTKLRNFVFNRDSFTCKYCSKKGGHLHAHHKIPFWVKPEAFEDVDNLITVCTDCHFDLAHNGNWSSFDVSIIENELLEKYSLDRERLSGLDAFSVSVCDSLNSSNK